MVLNTQIEIIEKVLQKSYGVPPKMIDYNWLRRYFRYIKKSKYHPLSLIFAIRFASKCFQIGEYDAKTHSIFISPAEKNKLLHEFKIYHELGHGYSYQKNTKLTQVNMRLEYAIQHAFTKPVYNNFEQDFLFKCVDEGISDYLAIESQKLETINGRRPTDVYCFRREWELVYNEVAQERQNILESTPLNKEIAKNLASKGKEFIDFVLNIKNAKSILEECILIEKAYANLPSYNYHLGHYLVRSSCFARATDRKGDVIDELINAPPVTVFELQEKVLNNMGI